MSPGVEGALVIFALALAAGLLLYLPFFLWFRFGRRDERNNVRPETRLTRVGWLSTVVQLALIFGGIAIAHLAPSSALGSMLQGRALWIFFGVVLIGSIVTDRLLGFIGLPTAQRFVLVRDPEALRNASAA